MKLLVTGASGHLGHLAVESLLQRGVPAGDVVAIARTPESIADLTERGVEVRRADYDDRASLEAAFAGVDRLLFVSGSEVGQRIAQHTNVIEAAKAAGVGFVAYTSIMRADRSDLILAAEHRATEQLLAASGLPHALLRNSWYLENYTGQVASALDQGVVLGAAGDGRVSAATRADFADAAAVVLAGRGPRGGRLRARRRRRLHAWRSMPPPWLASPAVRSPTATSRSRTTPRPSSGPACREGYAAVLADGDRGLSQGGAVHRQRGPVAAHRTADDRRRDARSRAATA